MAAFDGPDGAGDVDVESGPMTVCGGIVVVGWTVDCEMDEVVALET